MTILYLTQNGITDHIGQSQIAPYLLGLSAMGFRIHILSAEKPGRKAIEAEYRATFAAAGIGWTTIRYHNRPPLVGTLWDLVAMWRAAKRIAARESITLVHCRSHPPMLVAVALKRLTGARLLFDFRDFWADGGLAKGRFKPVYRWFKRREREFIATADHVVCLTRRAAEYLAATYPDAERPPEAKYRVIPCCADFTLFRPLPERQPRRRELGIADDATVLLYLGSIGEDYLLANMMALVVELRNFRPGAVFLLVCNNGAEMIVREARKCGLPDEAIRIVTSDRHDIPAYIAACDLSVVFIRADLSKLGCSPTKLAEVFACNIPVIANAGFGDIGEIADIDRNGSLAIPDFAPVTMRSSLERILAKKATGTPDIRGQSLEFSLDAGIMRYASIYGADRKGIEA